MNDGLNIISLILLSLSIGFFAFTMWQKKKLLKSINAKEEAIKLKEAEFNELRLLAASVTHEINNAITIVLGRTVQLLKRNEDPDVERILQNIQKASDRIVTSTKGLRQFIYPDFKEKEELIELPVLMEDVFKLSGQRIRNHGIEMRLKGLEHKVFKGRKTQLEQLIINLLNQSIERLQSLSEKWVQMVAVEEEGHLNLYFMDSSGEVGDQISHKQFSDILENNHGHLTVNQNNLIMELQKPNFARYHF